MSYRYSDKIGLQASDYRPAGQVAVYDHLITRLRDKVPVVTTMYNKQSTPINVKYTLEYPEDMMEDLPIVVLSFVSEESKEVGLGMVAGGRSYGEYRGMTKMMLFYLDIWARNSLERDLIADKITHCIHTSRNFFAAKGFRDVMIQNTGSRNFEQTRGALYPRQAQQTSRVFRKVLSIRTEYDTVFEPDSVVERIEQIDISHSSIASGASLETSFATESTLGGRTDLILDSKYVMKERLGDLVW